jgi:hypothetical protein
MRFNGMRRAALSAAVALPLGLASVSALASESLEVGAGQETYVDGTVRFKTVTVRAGGVLRVRSVGSGGTGTLTLKAESVVIEPGGKIDASAAGYSGTSGDGGTPICCPAAAGGAGTAGVTAPGGGGGNGGKGAAGCPSGGPGGEAYANLENSYPGAAGGASSFASGATDGPNAGGRGGGSISILAAKVTIEGEIVANGAPGIAYGGVGSGAGAGGVIKIDAFEVLGAGQLFARGGDGAEAFSGIGGGGGGGVIQIVTQKDLPMDGLGNTTPTRDASGGQTGAGTCAAAQDGVDTVVVDPNKTCTDADGDGHGAEGCGGDDCDDADPSVFGGASPANEVCDGQDNNCDGTIDGDSELLADHCPEGQTCQSGSCQSNGEGGAGGGDDAPPDYLDYRGACDMGGARAAHVNGAFFFAAALASFLAALGTRRKRR